SKLEGTNNHLLVNHEEMIKTYKTIAESLPNLLKKNFMKPTTFINDVNKGKITSDITLVDEAHLLLSREDPYNQYRGENHLKDIIQSSRSEEHTSELQSRFDLVCRLLLEKKK